MTVKEVIEKLQTVNPDAEFEVIAHSRSQSFTWSAGGSEGCTLKTCDSFGPYLDDSNTSESGSGGSNE